MYVITYIGSWMGVITTLSLSFQFSCPLLQARLYSSGHSTAAVQRINDSVSVLMWRHRSCCLYSTLIAILKNSAMTLFFISSSMSPAHQDICT